MSKETIQVVTASSASEVSFTEQLAEYQQSLKKKTDLTIELSAAKRNLLKLVKKYSIYKEGIQIDDALAEEIVVYVKLKQDQTITRIMAKEEGYHFQNLATNATVMNYLKKTFGKELCDFITEVGAKYGSVEKEVDEQATKKAQEEFVSLLHTVEKLEDELDRLNDSVLSTERYIATVEKISNIAKG